MKTPMTTRQLTALAAALLVSTVSYGQNWLTDGGDNVRSGWQKDEKTLTKDQSQLSKRDRADLEHATGLFRAFGLISSDVNLFDVSPLVDSAELALGRAIHVNIYSALEWASDDPVLSVIRTGPPAVKGHLMARARQTHRQTLVVGQREQGRIDHRDTHGLDVPRLAGWHLGESARRGRRIPGLEPVAAQ